MSELGRIARLRARYRSSGDSRVVGIGDDAAVLRSVHGDLVVTVDASIENVHFKRDFASLDVLAARAVQCAVSDLAAMGADLTGHGGGILSSWSLPDWLTEADFDLLADGTADAVTSLGGVVLGGNLSSGDVLAFHTTVLGVLPGPPMLRHGARPGDVLYVTGQPGRAALGLALLFAHDTTEQAAPFVHAWRSPIARLAEGVFIARYATSCIDLSDGLAHDAAQIARASGVSMVLDEAALRPSESFLAVCDRVKQPWESFVLHGGEDYELCFTAPPAHRLEESRSEIRRVGVVIEAREDALFLSQSGALVALSVAGFDHFSAESGTGTS